MPAYWPCGVRYIGGLILIWTWARNLGTRHAMPGENPISAKHAGESPDVHEGGGSSGRSDEAPVMGVELMLTLARRRRSSTERSGGTVAFRVDRRREAAANDWNEPCKSRGLRTVLGTAGGAIAPGDPAASSTPHRHGAHNRHTIFMLADARPTKTQSAAQSATTRFRPALLAL